MQRRYFLKSGAVALVTMGLSPSFLRRTAFGMEQWLDERDHHSAPASAASNPAKSGLGWLPRWLKSGGAGGERA